MRCPRDTERGGNGAGRVTDLTDPGIFESETTETVEMAGTAGTVGTITTATVSAVTVGAKSLERSAKLRGSDGTGR